ncbi:glycosyltransferase family 39 protein, partial [Candidatus Dojkabacteria bacterium]|nr:glycosyltransferase family 39 protein [Candidatus Dojkabacteria bacterium]
MVASILRLYQLSSVPASLFGDEMDVGYHAYSMLKTGKDYQGNLLPLNFHSLAEWRTPLYLYSAVPTVAIFGITPLGVRLPAVIYGVLSILGFYLLIKQLKINNLFETGNLKLETVASFLLAINPWNLQYSRAGFEVTMLLSFLLFGLYFFFYAINNKGKYLWLSGLLIVLTPIIYSTAKFFSLFLLLFLFIAYRSEIFSVSKRNLVNAFFVTLLFGLITSYSVLFSGGSQRFNYISVFSDPTTESEIGTARLNDARLRGETGTGLNPTFVDRLIHNKFTYWGQKIENNLVQTLSSDFLFLSGDPNPRHSM